MVVVVGRRRVWLGGVEVGVGVGGKGGWEGGGVRGGRDGTGWTSDRIGLRGSVGKNSERLICWVPVFKYTQRDLPNCFMYFLFINIHKIKRYIQRKQPFPR